MMLLSEIKPVIDGLNGALFEDFGVNVEFVSPFSKTPQDVIYFETVRRNASAPLIVTHTNMLFPVRKEGQLLGAIRVHNIQSLSPLDISEIKEAVDAALEEASKALTQAQVSLILDLESNVLPLRKLFDEKLATAN